MRRYYFVRHGQTAWNRENRLQGHSDLPLNPLGHQQAQRVGTLFASRHLQGIMTSPLQRSQQTAQAIVAGNGHGMSPVITQELAEIHLGVWEGLTPDEVDARYQGAYQQWRHAPSTVQIPKAEPLAVFQERVRRAFTALVDTVEEGEHVVVTHGGVIAALLADVLGADFDRLLRRIRLDNAGITALECGGSVPHILWINATDHLATLVDPPFGSAWL